MYRCDRIILLPIYNIISNIDQSTVWWAFFFQNPTTFRTFWSTKYNTVRIVVLLHTHQTNRRASAPDDASIAAIANQLYAIMNVARSPTAVRMLRNGPASRVVRRRLYAPTPVDIATQCEGNRGRLQKPDWNRAVSEAEKVVGYPSSFLSLRWLLSDEIANVALHLRRMVSSNHPLLKTIKWVVCIYYKPCGFVVYSTCRHINIMLSYHACCSSDPSWFRGSRESPKNLKYDQY